MRKLSAPYVDQKALGERVASEERACRLLSMLKNVMVNLKLQTWMFQEKKLDFGVK